MTKRIYLYIAGLILCVLSAYLISFFYNRDQIYENRTPVLNPAQVNTVNAILNRISYEEYEETEKYYSDEYVRLSVYRNVFIGDVKKAQAAYWSVGHSEEELTEIAGSYSMTAEQADETLVIYFAVSNCLRYALEYEDYLNYVYDNSLNLVDSVVFDDSTKDKIEERRNDFSALSGLRIKAYVTAGIEKLLNFSLDDILMLLGIILSVFFAYYHNADYWRSSVLTIRILILIGLFLIPVAVAAGINAVFPLGSLSMPVQSIHIFKTCSPKLTMGELLLLRTLLKCLFYYMLLLLLLFFCKKKKLLSAIFVPAAAIILEEAVLKGTAFDLLGIIRLERIMPFTNKEFFLYNVIAFSVLTIGIVVLEFCLQKIRHTEEQKAEQQYLNDINEKYNEIRTLKHDMNNHLSAVLLMLNAGQNDEAKHYIEELTGVTAKVSDIKKTGIKALDLLLWNKKSQSENEKIDFKVSISDELNDCNISEYEICSLFANIIDNAIEATGKLEETKRWIRLDVRRQMDLICIFCENPYSSLRKENNSFISTKKDSANHGLGLKQIRHIAEKHGGTVEIDTKEEVFSISVIMNI